MELTKQQQQEVDTETWKSLQRHVTRGEEALALLQAVYLDIGPYQRDQLSEKTWDKVRNFFHFDDSE